MTKSRRHQIWTRYNGNCIWTDHPIKREAEWESSSRRPKEWTWDIEGRTFSCHSDPRLIVSQTIKEYDTKDERMGAYQRLVKDLASRFKKIEFERIPREMKDQADRITHATSTSVEDVRVALVELLSNPSIPMDPGVMQIDSEEKTWMTPIMNYLTKGIQPNNQIEARKL
ncbi:hypothetical protein L3X38_038029 [Prunus dulcis]|uniref:Uncharacterized protein n=1 Tax=Prunus dulcis TaxID=3755 RepID=A0AAD4YR08_PRUDU|nr:hypothetical protein L3X38_038029 [Prunus dulcis]